MALARLAAGACVTMSALVAATQVPPSLTGGCAACRTGMELGHVYEASREGGLTESDTKALLQAVQRAGKDTDAFMVTILDGGMLELAHNMILSLDAVPCDAPRLLVGLGSNMCSEFDGDSKTTCVEVFRNTNSEDTVAWGSHEYWEVTFRKHVVLMVVAMSMASRHVIYSDPDIAFLACPAAYFVDNYEKSHDIVFSPNNMLDPNATSVNDVAETYEWRGIENSSIGPLKRRVDINTGLFVMMSSSKVTDLMLRTMRIFKEQEFVHGHYQQFSLVRALDQVPGLRIGVADGGRLVNGNVFWGHRRLLNSAEVVSVHANWMQSHLKVPCLKEAGLWMDASSPTRLSRENWADRPVARMDAAISTVESCGAGASAVQASPMRSRPDGPFPRPAQPGCYLWLPTGCRDHQFHAQDAWRWIEDLRDGERCQRQARAAYNEWCGTQDARTLFVKPLEDAPAEPGDAGCYVWMPSGCEARNFHAMASWRQASASEYPSAAACAERAPERYNAWCGTSDAKALWVGAPPAAPSEPGCYAFFPTACKYHALNGSIRGWIRDVHGERAMGARADREACEQRRRSQIDAWCGISNTKMAFVEGA